MQFSHLNFVKLIPKLNKCKYRISYKGPFIWNNFDSTTDEKITDFAKFAKFKAATKSKLLSLESEVSFFLQEKKLVLLCTYSVRQLN